MHTPEYYMGRIERMLDDLLDTQPHRDDLRQNIYDSYVNLAESRDGLLAACKAARWSISKTRTLERRLRTRMCSRSAKDSKPQS